MLEDDRPDIELLRATRGGDSQAFGAFFRRHRAVVLAFLGRRTRNSEVAADLLAESFAAALVTVLDLERELPEQPLAWLMTVARNKLIDSVRRGQVVLG
jgi:DNA-directed RNA polymerase specialized sigma24 family protein